MDGEPPTSSKRVRVNKSAVHKELNYEDHLTDSKTEIKEAGERVLLLEKQLEELNVVPGVYRFMHLPCVAHKCHIIVEKSINNRLHCFGSIVKKCRSTVVKYRQSTKAKALLRAYYPRYTCDSFLILMAKTLIHKVNS